MPWTNLPTRSSGYTMTAASDWNPAVNNFAFLRQVALVQFVSDVTVTSTTEGGQLVVSSGAISYENVLHKIEFGCPSFVTPGSGTMFISLYDSTTQVGRIVQIAAVPPEVPGAVMPGLPDTDSGLAHIHHQGPHQHCGDSDGQGGCGRCRHPDARIHPHQPRAHLGSLLQMGFRYRSLTPAGVAGAGRCPDCGQNSDGDFDVKRGEGRYQLWAVCSTCKTAWQIGGGTHPTMEKSEGDLAANAVLIGDYRVVDPLPPEEADPE